MKRVALGSFGLSLMLGALYLGFESIAHFRVRCEDGGHSECAFVESTARELGRRQALGATGCMLAGAGTLLYLRTQRKEP